MNCLDGINIASYRTSGNCDTDCNFGYHAELCKTWLIECRLKNINILGIDLIMSCIFVMKKRVIIESVMWLLLVYLMTTEKYIMVKNTCDISLKNANCQNTTVCTCTYMNNQRDITDKFTQKPISYNFFN